jgi:class 3 adenylate cyclase
MRSRARSSGRRLATVLFTDIVSSTELAASIGDRRWRALLAAYRAMVRDALRRTHGREVDDAGDGFFAVFEHPADAIACGCLLTEEVRTKGLEVRSGIHMGEVETTGAKIGGIAVHIGARVCAQAGAGEVLVSSTVRDVVRGSEFGFVDLGARPLKGVPGEIQLFRVTWPEGEMTAVGGRSRRALLIASAGGVAVVVVAVVALVALVPRHAGVAAGPQIVTVAGTGVSGDGPDGKQATATEVGHPIAVALDPAGRLYFVEDNLVRRINSNGTVTTIAGTGVAGFSGDGGPGVAAELNGPQSVAIDGIGDVFIADSLNNRIREVTPDGIITTIAGSSRQGYGGDHGQAIDAALNDPTGVAIGFGGPTGSIVIADRGNNRVRMVTASGATFANAIITTVAGTGQASYEGDGHLAVNAELDGPQCVAVDSEDDIYIADVGNDLVRVVDAGGTINPAAGDGTTGFTGDHSQATFAELDLATSGGGCLAVDTADHLFIADAANNRVREVVFNASGGGVITTVAGDGLDGFNGDNLAATATSLSRPLGIATGLDGTLYIADSDANRIRRAG